MDVSSVRHKEIPVVKIPETDAPLEMLAALFEEHGDIVSYDSCYGKVVQVNHPDFAKIVCRDEHFIRTPLISMIAGEGLLRSEGDYWRNQRRIAQPSFHTPCMHGYAHLVSQHIENAFAHWQSDTYLKGAFDISQEIRCLTMAIIADTMFSVKLKRDELLEWDLLFQRALSTVRPFILAQLNQPVKVNAQQIRQQKAAIQKIDTYIYELIEQRRNMAEPPLDYLTSFIQGEFKAEHAPLSDLQVRDEVFTMLLAGHETTALSIAWTLHALLENPSALESVVTEIDTHLKGEAPGIEDLKSLPLLDKSMKEAIRLYPPVWFTTRITDADTQIGEYLIPSDTIVSISIFTMHRHRDYWDNPSAFEVDRFESEAEKTRHKHAYMPFLAGRHQCIGQGFAQMENGLIIANLLQRYTLSKVAGHTASPAPALTLRLKDGLQVLIAPRS
jgi:cytochrome P450